MLKELKLKKPKYITFKSKWGDYTLKIKGVCAQKDKETGKLLIKEDELEYIEALTILMSKLPKPPKIIDVRIYKFFKTIYPFL